MIEITDCQYYVLRFDIVKCDHFRADIFQELRSLSREKPLKQHLNHDEMLYLSSETQTKVIPLGLALQGSVTHRTSTTAGEWRYITRGTFVLPLSNNWTKSDISVENNTQFNFFYCNILFDDTEPEQPSRHRWRAGWGGVAGSGRRVQPCCHIPSQPYLSL